MAEAYARNFILYTIYINKKALPVSGVLFALYV